MVLLALSLQDQVEKYGSYVGIAAFFGLAILSLLYFAQAREVKRLREWAGRAPERAREVEEAALAAAEAARRRPAPAAVQQQAPAQSVAAATAAGGRSGTPVSAVPVGAATAVAERPEGEEPSEEDDDPPAVEGPVTEDGRRPVAAVPPAAEAKPTGDGEEPEEPEDPEAAEAAERDDDDLRDEAADADTDTDTADGDGEAQPTPASAAPTNGAPPAAAERPVFPRPSTAAGAAGAGTASAAAAGAASAAGTPAPSPAPAARAAGSGTPAPKRPASAMPVRAAAPSASPRRAAPTLPPRRPQPSTAASSSGRGGRRWAIAGGVAAVVAALGIYAATQLLGREDTPSTPNQAATPTAAPTEDSPSGGGGSTSANRGDTTVAVFNGTTINGLAASTADKVQSSGYKRGSTGDYTDQQRATSTVFYRRDARRQARDIARELDISDQRVMDAETQALAGERAAIAVVIGADKAP
jgi:hypothetical protein